MLKISEKNKKITEGFVRGVIRYSQATGKSIETILTDLATNHQSPAGLETLYVLVEGDDDMSLLALELLK